MAGYNPKDEPTPMIRPQRAQSPRVGMDDAKTGTAKLISRLMAPRATHR